MENGYQKAIGSLMAGPDFKLALAAKSDEKGMINSLSGWRLQGLNKVLEQKIQVLRSK